MATRYQEIARVLRDRIEDGTYPPGSKLPAIPELMDEWDVARDTVRDAVSRLTHEGLVTPRRGVGTVVRDASPVALGYAPTTPAQAWAVQAGEESDQLISAEWVGADPGIVQRLQLTPNSQVVYRLRHQSKGKALAQIMEQWLPEHVVTAIKDATGVDLADATTPPPTDLFTLMRRAELAPAQVTETLRARMPDPDETSLMDLPAGVPVLVTYRVTESASSTPLETSTFAGAGDRMSQSFTVPLEK